MAGNSKSGKLKNIEEQLKGGHPNSLGNTINIVAKVLQNNTLFPELFHCYFSTDEVVRLRTSNAMKRIAREKKALLLPYLDRFLKEISKIDQASTQWTLAQLFGILENDMNKLQMAEAKKIMKNNIANHKDWIVLNMTMDTLARWAQTDLNLKKWLVPHLQRLTKDSRKSVSKKAMKMLNLLSF